MNVFSNVKKVLLINLALGLVLIFPAANAKMEIIPQFFCGAYLVRGHFIFTKSGDFILRLRDKSSSPFELIILGGKTDEKMKNLDATVVAKIFVEKNIKSNNRPFVKLTSFVADNNELAKFDDYKLLKQHSCK